MMTPTRGSNWSAAKLQRVLCCTVLLALAGMCGGIEQSDVFVETGNNPYLGIC